MLLTHRPHQDRLNAGPCKRPQDIGSPSQSRAVDRHPARIITACQCSRAASVNGEKPDGRQRDRAADNRRSSFRDDDERVSGGGPGSLPRRENRNSADLIGADIDCIIDDPRLAVDIKRAGNRGIKARPGVFRSRGARLQLPEFDSVA